MSEKKKIRIFVTKSRFFGYIDENQKAAEYSSGSGEDGKGCFVTLNGRWIS